MILAVSVVTTFFKYILLVVEARLEGRFTNKSTYMFYLEFTADLLRLFLYLMFFLIICM